MTCLDWSSCPTGSIITSTPLDPTNAIYSKAIESRNSMVEEIANLHDPLLEAYLDTEGDTLKIPSLLIKQALRKATCEGTAIPVLIGASYRNKGVQPLLDSVIILFIKTDGGLPSFSF